MVRSQSNKVQFGHIFMYVRAYDTQKVQYSMKMWFVVKRCKFK
jgi:hypothetical protein